MWYYLNPSFIDKISIKKIILLAGIIRLFLIIYAHFHDSFFRIKYTDIDYMIIIDGAKEIWLGGSPFNRTTFRYTPLLAILMLPSIIIIYPMGKLLFTFCDLIAGYYCYTILITFSTEQSAKWMISLLILFNPIVLNVSTRGNSDMLVTSMSLFMLEKFIQHKYYQASIILGFAIHFKLYPIIYIFPLILSLWEQIKIKNIFQKLIHIILLIIHCSFITIICFIIPTLLCYFYFGQQYLNEAFLYHLYREDHRHNFSLHWLLMYLNMAYLKDTDILNNNNYSQGLIVFIPQILLLLFVSYKLRHNVAHACCIETMLFIAFNKVCTVQYFVWFIPFLTFIFSEPRENKNNVYRPGVLKMVSVSLLWVVTIPLWMSTAVPLEFYGRSCFGKLWGVSCLFFLTMVSISAWLARVACRLQMGAAQAKKIEKLT